MSNCGGVSRWARRDTPYCDDVPHIFCVYVSKRVNESKKRVKAGAFVGRFNKIGGVNGKLRISAARTKAAILRPFARPDLTREKVATRLVSKFSCIGKKRRKRRWEKLAGVTKMPIFIGELDGFEGLDD
jgi:hypothetical protein